MSRTAVWVAVALLLGACGGDAPPPDAQSEELSEDSIEALAALPAVAPDMPPTPAAGAGRVRVASVGSLELERNWEGAWGQCEDLGMLVLLAEDPEAGVTIRLDVADAAVLVGAYPVSPADTVLPPEGPGLARVGAQRFDVTTLEAYRATAGTVHVASAADAGLTGHLAVTLEQTTNRRLASMAGAFRAVPLRPQPPDWCASLAEPADATAADSTAAGTARG